MIGYCFVFKFPRRSVGGKYLMRFQSENSVFKFLWRNFGPENKLTCDMCYAGSLPELLRAADMMQL